MASPPVGLMAQLVEPAPVSLRQWVQIPFQPEFFSGFNFKHLNIQIPVFHTKHHQVTNIMKKSKFENFTWPSSRLNFSLFWPFDLLYYCDNLYFRCSLVFKMFVPGHLLSWQKSEKSNGAVLLQIFQPIAYTLSTLPPWPWFSPIFFICSWYRKSLN